MATKKKTKLAFTPIADRVLVRPAEAETVSKSGIVLPDSAQEKPMRGEVLAAGKGRTSEDGSKREMQVSVGDLVVYGKYSGNDIKFGDQDYKILRVEEILAVIEN